MKRATITRGFWHERLQVNAQHAIFHQWQQLEASGCIQNFRIAAGEAEGLREGWFFADSDAYKWLDAAARIWASQPDERLAALMDDCIALLGRAQMPDGYIFTYNQIHFPGTRWQNLQIEHELYCHGHLIEAGVSHFEATGRLDLIEIARKAADRVVADFKGKGPDFTPGHEEIEIALLRLHQATGISDYLQMARQFIEQRGRTPLFALSLLRQNARVDERRKIVKQQRQEYLAAHPDFKPFQLPPGNPSKQQPNAKLRWYASALSGKYFQQHKPIRRQGEPVGHAVRFAYFETAAALLARQGSEPGLVSALERVWERMVTRRMYITGGIGSQPGLEGFGNDYELDPEYAYAETCAALGSLFWNWEMANLTGKARYSDLFEWQLYNAAAVGMGLDGATYLYNNPLACRDGSISRQGWYVVPCCPSNLSRTWADLGRYIYSVEPGKLRVHQYISSEVRGLLIPDGKGENAALNIVMESGLPWQGCAQIKIMDGALDEAVPFELQFRQPAWAEGGRITLNGEEVQPHVVQNAETGTEPAAGYDPRRAVFRSIRRLWSPGDVLEVENALPIRLRRAHPKMKGHAGKAAVTRGPLVYCLESVDNPDVDIFSARVDAESLTAIFDPGLLGGCVKIEGHTLEGTPLTFVPYFLWGNRGSSQMTVWVNLE